MRVFKALLSIIVVYVIFYFIESAPNPMEWKDYSLAILGITIVFSIAYTFSGGNKVK